MKDELQKVRAYVFVLVLVFTGAYIVTKSEAFLQLMNLTVGALVMSLRAPSPQ